jgi:hypothetical protein
MEDAKTQTITSFEEHTPPAAQDVPPPADLRPDTYTNRPDYRESAAVNVLLLDALNTPLGDQMQARARARCENFSITLSVVRNPNCTYLQMVEERQMVPSAQFRQCTSDLKRRPIDKFIRGFREKVIVNCIGIRSDESNPRSRLAPWKLNGPLTTRQRTVYNRLPIFRLTLEQVLEWHRARRIPLHPIYVPEYHWDGHPWRLSPAVVLTHLGMKRSENGKGGA